MRIFSICIGKTKGMKKQPVQSAVLIANHGIEGDAHAGDKKRQVSLLSIESIEKLKDIKTAPGMFAENITTKGINWKELKVGDKFKIGKTATLEITQIGKECHSRCAIFEQMGDCIMPREGVFARALVGGEIKNNDLISIC